jgi:hypothetical protein
MAYRAALGLSVPREPLDELSRNPDAATALWASYAMAVSIDRDSEAVERLQKAAAADGPLRPLAQQLLAARTEPQPDKRLEILDRATVWLRTGHPEASQLWRGWSVVGDRIVRGSAPELRNSPAR